MTHFLVLNKYIDVFDTKLRKRMNVEPVQLNMREGSKPYTCFSCRPTPAHYRESASKLALCLVVDFTRLNEQLIRDQPQVFPTGKEIRQQLGPNCKVWICMDALAAYFHIKVRKEDCHKTTFMLHFGRYFLRKTTMGN